MSKKKLCQMAWRSMPKELTFWILTKLFCNNGFAKYHPAFNVHNYLQSESKSFVFNSSCDWRSCLSETFCWSDRSSAQTFMSKYINQLRGKQNLSSNTSVRCGQFVLILQIILQSTDYKSYLPLNGHLLYNSVTIFCQFLDCDL